MPAKTESLLPITFELGLLESAEASVLPPGAAAALKNWEPSPGGGLRVREGWNKTSRTGGPTTPTGWGIGHVAKQRRPARVQLVTGSSTTSTVSAIWSKPTQAGNLLIAIVNVNAGSATTITPPSVSGNPWTLAVRVDNGTSTGVAIYYIQNAAGQAGQSTWTVSGGTLGTVLFLLEIANAGGLRTTATATGASATGSTGTTPVNSPPVAYAISAISTNADGATHSNQTNGFTEIREVENPSATEGATAVSEKIITARWTVGHTDTISTAAEWAGAVAVFEVPGYTSTDGFYVVAHRASSQSMELYRIDRAQLGSASAVWWLLDSFGVSLDTVPVAFTSGLGRLLYTHPSFYDMRAWSGVPGDSPVGVVGAPAGRCIAFHKSRVFVGGTVGEPSRLYWSEVGDHMTWSGGTTGYINVNADDGEAIEDIVPFEDNLLIAKQTSLWVLVGSGPQDFQLIRLPQGGAAPGRVLMPTPIGCVVAGRKHVWLVSGGSVELISRPIERSYAMTGNWMSTAYINNVVRILDEGSSTIFALDVKNGTWWQETIDDWNEAPVCLYSHDDKLLFAPRASAQNGLLGWRLMPGSLRRKDFDTLSETFEVWTPEIWPVGPERKFAPLHLYLKLRQRGEGGTEAQTGLTVTPYCDGEEGASMTIEPRPYTGTFWERLDLSPGRISSVQFRIRQTVPSGETSVMDIEEMTLGFLVEEVV